MSNSIVVSRLKRQSSSFALAVGRQFVTLAFLLTAAAAQATGPVAETVARVKPSIVAVGTVQKTRSPQFVFLGTGFVVGTGNLVVTNAHVVKQGSSSSSSAETLVAAIPSDDPQRAQVRAAQLVAENGQADLVLLRIEGQALPALKLRDSALVRDGESYLMTGFPLGNLLGLYPVTHQMMIAAISPIAIPTPSAQSLDARIIRQIQRGPFPIFQLDGTSYPGNSGSPLYDAATGDVVGVMNMALIKGSREAALSQPSGIAYAIPSVHIAELLKTLKE